MLRSSVEMDSASDYFGADKALETSRVQSATKMAVQSLPTTELQMLQCGEVVESDRVIPGLRLRTEETNPCLGAMGLKKKEAV